jgi:hypothetical protein
MRKLLNSQMGQGTTEYIVILAIVVAIAVGIFYGPIKNALTSKVGEVATNIQQSGK